MKNMKKEVLLIFLLLIPIVFSSEIIMNQKEGIITYNVELTLENTSLTQDSFVNANIRISGLPDTQKRQFIINFYIKYLNDKIIAKDTKTIVIEKELNVKKEFYLTKKLEPGKYNFITEAIYQDSIVSDSKPFNVELKLDKKSYFSYSLYSLIIIAILVIAFLIIFERNKLKDIEKKLPEQLKRICGDYKKTKKKQETLIKLKKQLRLINEAKDLRVISDESYEKASNSIKKVINKINR